jgi:hypothetical protein
MVCSLDELLEAAQFTPAEIKDIFNGKVVKGIVDSTNERELAAKFAFLVQAPVPQLQEMAMTTTKTPEKDPSVIQSGMIVEGTLEEFHAISAAGAVCSEYIQAQPSQSLNLSKPEIAAFQALNMKKKKNHSSDHQVHQDVEHQIRLQLFERYHAYRKHGLAQGGIAPYARTKTNNYTPGEELRLKTKLAPILQRESPMFYKCINEYPTFRPKELKESFSWVVYSGTNNGRAEKPNFVLIHRMGMLEDNKVYMLCERHFYVSRGHNSVQGVFAAFPVEGKDVDAHGDGDKPNQTAVLYLSRTSTDQVAGFGGAAKRTIGARIMSSKICENMERVRELEKQKVVK